jgi:hypothetical protein
MEALPPGSLFGLIGISDCITLVDMSGQRVQQGLGWSCTAICTAHLLSMVGSVAMRAHQKSAVGIFVAAVLLHATRMDSHAM